MKSHSWCASSLLEFPAVTAIAAKRHLFIGKLRIARSFGFIFLTPKQQHRQTEAKPEDRAKAALLLCFVLTLRP